MRKWVLIFLISLFSFLSTVGLLNVIIDPFFHYHKPIRGLAYKIDDERYQNDGIIRHFDFDALIIGTSMTENFKTTEFDTLFNAKAIKVPFSGASTREIKENIDRALERRGDIKIVLWGLDYSLFYENYLNMKYDNYPTYLYDDEIFNDVNYILNKEVLINGSFEGVLINTIKGGSTTSFDDYKNWDKKCQYGKESVLNSIRRANKLEDVEIRPMDSTNLDVNILDVIDNNPNVEFYLFWTPYSIVYFDDLNQKGQLKLKLSWEKEALEKILIRDNVHFYSFIDCFDIITNLDNYKDYLHYSGDVNSYILKCISEGEHEITMDNYQEYCELVYLYYTKYDYNSIWE